MFSLEKAESNLATVYSFLKGSSRGEGADLQPPVTSDRSQRKEVKLYHEKLRHGI